MHASALGVCLSLKQWRHSAVALVVMSEMYSMHVVHIDICSEHGTYSSWLACHVSGVETV